MGCQESEPADKSSNAKCFKDPMLAYKRNFQ